MSDSFKKNNIFLYYFADKFFERLHLFYIYENRNERVFNVFNFDRTTAHGNQYTNKSENQ